MKVEAKTHYKKIVLGSRRDGTRKVVDLHRYLMEQHLGRKLSRNEIVHHIDGDRNNNEISNLRVMTIWGHNKLHNCGSTGKKGSDNIACKLTEQQVIEIRAANGTNEDIGAAFGISDSQVARIKLRQSWKHLL